MDVKQVSPPTDWAPMSQTSQSAQTEGATIGETFSIMPVNSLREAQQDNSERSDDQKNKQRFNIEDMLPITKELNKFLTYLNADLQFELHDGTKQLMVKVVDLKENKVLREFPPHELLDTIANIREYIGILLDKKV